MSRLWRCPRCGHRFVTRNLWHSCGRRRLRQHFAGRPAALLAAFRRLVAVARTAGPVTVYAQKTRIVLQARVRFASVVVHGAWLDVGLWLKRRVRHARVRHIENYGRLGYGVHLRLAVPADVDRGVAALVGEAHAAAVRPARQGVAPRRHPRAARVARAS